jgi:hypothetical protein
MMTIPDSYAPFVAIGLLAGMVAMLEWGHRVGDRRRAKLAETDAAGMGAIEAAVFALLGLLIAFTFQGAASRFDARREQIVDEANIIGTAWLRLDLLPAPAQPELRALFRDYLDSRIDTYRLVPDFAAVETARLRSIALQGDIWRAVLTARAAADADSQAIVVGVLPMLNEMFDIVTTRTMAVETHPPAVVFAMLAGMALVAAFMAGHGMSGVATRSWVHSLGFALILSTTIYVILDLEYPRLGLIRVDAFDHVLVDLRASME